MAFPSAIGTKPDTQSDAWQNARGLASRVKQHAKILRDSSAAGAISVATIISIATELADARVTFSRLATVPGIGAYAQEQLNDPGFDLGAAFTAMIAAMDATVAWIIANFPKDGSDYLLAQQFTAEGRTTWRVLNTAQTAGLRTELDALLATID